MDSQVSLVVAGNETICWSFFPNILDIWAKTCGESEAKGNKLPIMDSLIAATAYEHDLTIVTRNIGDFNFSSVKVFSPWNLPTENSN